MGRGNFSARGDMAEQWYIDYDNYHSYDGSLDICEFSEQ